MSHSGTVAKYFNFTREPPCGTMCATVGHTTISPRAGYPANPDRHPPRYARVHSGRSLDEFQIVYIPAGGGSFTDDTGATSAVAPGTIMLLFPQVPHAYSPSPDSGWEEFWVGCTGSYPEWLLQENGFRRSRPLLSVGRDPQLLGDFIQLCRTAVSGKEAKNRGQALGGVINRLIGRLLVLRDRPSPYLDPRDGKAFATARAHLEARLDEDMEMRELPAIAGMKYDRLCRIFRQTVGMTPHQYYLHRRMERAEELLRSGMSVSEASQRLGFDTPYYFSRIFKKKTGYAPSRVRKHGMK